MKEKRDSERRNSVVIELLSAKPGEPGDPVERGLSINLLPPEEGKSSEAGDSDDQQLSTDRSQSYYQSQSGISATSFESIYENERSEPSSSGLDTDIPIPKQNVRLLDLADTASQSGLLPLHRTESRLPSLEDMLQDEQLWESLYGPMKSVLLTRLSTALKHKNDNERFRELQLLLKDALNNPALDINKATPRERNVIIDTFVLFIKQNLSRSVAHWRYLLDEKELGHIDQGEFDQQLMYAPYDKSVKPWAYIGLCLKILRNWCTSADIQELLAGHNIAETLINRKLLILGAYATATKMKHEPCDDPERAQFIKEVSDFLPKSIFTFLSNLVANNDRMRGQLLPLMWPDCYWLFMLMAGEKFFDHFIRLLHNHIAPLFTHEVEDIAPDDSLLPKLKEHSTTQELAQDFEFITTDLEDLDPSASLSPEFTKFFRLILSMVWIRHYRHVQASQMRHPRLASAQGRSLQEEVMGEDWFALLLLRVLSSGKGSGLKLLLDAFEGIDEVEDLDVNMDDTSRPSLRNLLLRLGCPESLVGAVVISEEEQIQRSLPYLPKNANVQSILLYSAAEYAAVQESELYEIQKHSSSGEVKEDGTFERQDTSGEIRRKSDLKLGRKWNLVRRSFLTTEILNRVKKMSTVCLQDLVDIKQSFAEDPTLFSHIERLSSLEKGKPRNAALALRACVKCLISLALAPEMSKKWTQTALEKTFDASCAILKDAAPLLQDHSAKKNANEGPFVEFSHFCSCRDILLLIAALVQLCPQLRDRVTEEDVFAVMNFDQFQTVDVGAEQASHLAIKVLTEGHSANAGIAASVVSASKARRQRETSCADL